MPCHAIHPIQDLFLEGFSYVLQIDMHFICTPMLTKFYSYKKWVLHASPQLDQPLILYVSATRTAVSEALVQEREISREDRKLSHQVPIYFVSEALAGSKKYYSEMEKICYVVVMSARKLQHYFEAHKSAVEQNFWKSRLLKQNWKVDHGIIGTCYRF
jgi:hypothetical protein